MPMPKLPFEYVLREVEILYSKEFAEDALDAIDKHIDFIRSFINACGWSEEEFQRADFGFKPIDMNKENN